MKRDSIPGRGEKLWTVTSGARLLQGSVPEALIFDAPAPRRRSSRRWRRPYSPPRVCLIPLSRRPAFRDY